MVDMRVRKIFNLNNLLIICLMLTIIYYTQGKTTRIPQPQTQAQAASNTNITETIETPTQFTATTEPSPEAWITATPESFSLISWGYAGFHIPFESMEGVKFEKMVVVIVLDNDKPVSVNIPSYSVPSETCGSFTREDGIAYAYVMAKRFGLSFLYVGPLIASESMFTFFVSDGNGGCKIIQNYQGAQAFCAGQIYGPKGWGGVETHPNINLYPIAENRRDSLQDPVYCMAASMKILNGFGGNSVLAAARYKGFSSENDPLFVSNYMPTFNSQMITINGVDYPFNNDQLLEERLGEHLTRAMEDVENFYQQYPNVWGN